MVIKGPNPITNILQLDEKSKLYTIFFLAKTLKNTYGITIFRPTALHLRAGDLRQVLAS